MEVICGRETIEHQDPTKWIRENSNGFVMTAEKIRETETRRQRAKRKIYRHGNY
jgi:hypothetical protein